MNYNRLVIVSMMLLGSMRLEAMKPESPQPAAEQPSSAKKIVSALIKVDQTRIDAYKDRFKNWEKKREPRLAMASYMGLAVGAAYTGFALYNLWKDSHPTPAAPAAPVVGAVAAKADHDNLVARVILLENAPPAPPVPVGWKKWGTNKLEDGRSAVTRWIPYMVKGAIISTGSSYISGIILRSPLSEKVTQVGDYMFRSRTMLWLLEKECKLKLALQSLKRGTSSVNLLLQGNPIYKRTLIISVNTLVKEMEKMVGHMEFVKDQLDPLMENEIQSADTMIANVTESLNTILLATQEFLDVTNDQILNLEAFAQVYLKFLKGIGAGIEIMLTQMEAFDYIQAAVGLSDLSSESGDPTAREIDNLRSIVLPRKRDEAIQIDPWEEMAAAQITNYLIQEGTRKVLTSIVPPFSTT